MIDVVLKAYLHDGNDPLEADVQLPAIPRNGDTISVWTGSGLDHETFLNVEGSHFESWGPNIYVHVAMDGYDADELREAFAALKEKRKP